MKLLQIQRGLDGLKRCPIEGCDHLFRGRVLLVLHLGVDHKIAQDLCDKVTAAMEKFGGIEQTSLACRIGNCSEASSDKSIFNFLEHLTVDHFQNGLLGELKLLQVCCLIDLKTTCQVKES